MLTKWLDEKVKYDGSQLQALRNYLEHKMLGDSVLAWRGACDVSFDNMKDGEDLLDRSTIRGDDMVHFIFEIFDVSLFAGVCFQRLVADLAKTTLLELASSKPEIVREGDDLYLMPDRRKFSISIAIPSLNSALIHFAINATNKGTPVPTASLEDVNIDPKAFAASLMKKTQKELQSTREATWKVRP